MVLGLVCLALFLGFIVGRYTINLRDLKFFSKSPSLDRRYFEGLTFLLKDEADEAIDRFVTDMEVNSNTLEVHLSLAGLLRRKGEVSRAVKVHENLLNSSQLSQSQTHLVQLELSQDYFHSGLLDRAERLLRELVDQTSIAHDLRGDALKRLIEIYQSTSEWLKAIDIADRLTERKFSGEPDEWRKAQAHYCCELALSAFDNPDGAECAQWLRSALSYDVKCVRASLLQARFDLKAGDIEAAIGALRSIPSQNSELASEMVAPLYECYIQRDKKAEFVGVLNQYLGEHKDIRALRLLFELSCDFEGVTSALKRIVHFLPSYSILGAVKELCLTLDAVVAPHDVERFRSVFNQLLNVDVYYECVKCGFNGQEIHWLCPSCTSWGSMHLVNG